MHFADVCLQRNFHYFENWSVSLQICDFLHWRGKTLTVPILEFLDWRVVLHNQISYAFLVYWFDKRFSVYQKVYQKNTELPLFYIKPTLYQIPRTWMQWYSRWTDTLKPRYGRHFKKLIIIIIKERIMNQLRSGPQFIHLLTSRRWVLGKYNIETVFWP